MYLDSDRNAGDGSEHETDICPDLVGYSYFVVNVGIANVSKGTFVTRIRTMNGK